MSFLEIVGFIFGVAGVWLTIKKNIWCFPVGIVNVLITAWLVFNKTLFADTLQQIVYFILLVVGWINWNKSSESNDLKISFLSQQYYVALAVVFITGSLLMGYVFSNYSNASFPYWDSIATVICFIAQWLIAKRKIENWILWIVANPMYIVMYILKDLPLYAALSFIYLVMAIVGWIEWKKIMRQQHAG